MKYHFHITSLHKYRFFVFCLYSSCVYLCRVVMWKWYFILFLKPSCSCAFSVLIYIPTYAFIFFIILVSILYTYIYIYNYIYIYVIYIPWLRGVYSPYTSRSHGIYLIYSIANKYIEHDVP